MRVTRYRPIDRLRVEPIEGSSVRETLRELAAAHAGVRLVVHGRGSVDAVRLDGASAPVSGVLEVVDVSGDGEALRLVARATDGAVLAGVLVDARAVDLVLDVELLEPLEEPSATTKAAPTRLPSRQDVQPSWADVAAATRAREAEEAERPEAPTPEVGDRVEHATFGTCTVEKVDADEDVIMVRNAAQRLLRLSLDVLRLEVVADTEGVRTFRARPARPAGRR